MKTLLTFLCTLFFLHINAQVWDKTLNDTLNIVQVSPTQDNGCVIAGFPSGTNRSLNILKLDAVGNKVWKKEFTDVPLEITPSFAPTRISMIQDLEGNYWFSMSTSNSLTSLLMKFDKDGNRLTTKQVNLRFIDIYNANNQILVFGVTNNNSSGSLLRLTIDGSTIDEKPIPQIRFSTVPFYSSILHKNTILIFSFSDTTRSRQTTRLNLDGTVASRNVMPPTGFVTPYPLFNNIAKTSDGGFIIPDSATVYKVDSVGRFVWQKNLGISIPVPNHYVARHLIAARNSNGEFLGILPNSGLQQINIKRYFTDGSLQASNTFTYSGTFGSPFLIKTIKGGYLLVGQTTNNSRVRLMKLDDEGYLYPNFITGNVFSDRDNNCALSGNDIGIQRVLVTAQKAGQPELLAMTDTTGKYALNVEAGTYNISIVNPNPYMQPCIPSVSKTVGSGTTKDSANFALKSNFSCALMQVDVSTPRLRRCFNNNYTVSYCNKGTATAMGAYVNITLDSLLEFVSAGKTVASKNGRTYRFNLGDLAINDCKTFDFIARVRCGDSTRLNQTLCVEAKIYPDTICGNDNSLWSGANFTVSGTCQTDSVVFQVRNTGTAATATTVATVVENLSARNVTIPALSPNSVFTQKFKSNNNTWRMTVNQVANNPRSTQPTTFVEGCRANSAASFTTGFAAGFANDDAYASIDMDCQPIIGAYDPNDKIGYPLGTGTTKAIGQNQDIEYLIRFQNTGTDTAFTVVVRDTIDITNLDIKSIELGTSSHKYLPEIYRENILKFTFDNILLVDSFRNEPASNGYVKFRIRQKKDVAFGTKIQNSAGIYFDFNDPVITNKTLHTVSKSVVSAIFDKNVVAYKTINVSPNPMSESAIIDFTDTPLSISSQLELYDMNGQLVKTQIINDKVFKFNKENLPNGFYIFKAMDGETVLGIGKIIIQK